jgi:hypothetical protein
MLIMAKRSITILELAASNADDSVNTIKVQVRYEMGGINYFTYRPSARGFYVSVMPVKIEHRDGFTSESFTAFSGTKSLLMEANRFSDKKLNEAAEQGHPDNNAIVRAMIAKVISENGLTLTQASQVEVAA